MSVSKLAAGGDPPRPKVPMKVIVASLPRTGTSSMKLALQQLGIHEIYHMTTYVDHPEDLELWSDAVNAKKDGKNITRAQWDQLLGNCQGICDAPAGYFAVELAQAYPEAKVVILNRDFEKWYTSISNTVQRVIRLRRKLHYLEMLLRPWMPARASAIIRLGNHISFSGVGFGDYSKEKTKKFFDDYYADCRKRIPSDRILEFKVQDGWGPLVKHLGTKPPGYETENGFVEAPFPRVNDTAAFGDRVAEIQRHSWLAIGKNMAVQALTLIGIVAIGGYVKGLIEIKPFW
ncbi:hypothetical protein DL768_002933 [Monosporascus sp. mg162]|nr:hypothetical protein DL768_002933 [Monosporascus sp. mg162]